MPSRYETTLLLIVGIVLCWSAINPHDSLTWWLEVAPVLIAVPILAFSYSRFRLTPLVYALIAAHMVILMVGGHYTYAEVPLFDTISEIFGLSRNHYDRVGHFAQGFVPAMVAREILIRKEVFHSRKWMNFFIVCFCLAFSAFYELIEWWAAVGLESGAEDFLGTQGDVWDTQTDMFLALIGSIAALAVFSKKHDHELGR